MSNAIEKRLVRGLVRALKQAGYLPECVWDGGEYVDVRSEADVLEIVFAVDESTIHFDRGAGANGRSHGVFVVCGNGIDCIGDWHIGDKAFDAAVTAYVDAAISAGG